MYLQSFTEKTISIYSKKISLSIFQQTNIAGGNLSRTITINQSPKPVENPAANHKTAQEEAARRQVEENAARKKV